MLRSGSVPFRLALAALAALLLIPVAHAQPPHAAQGPNDSDYSAAKRWLALIAGGDAASFETLTSVPFVFAVSAGPDKCQGTVKKGEELGGWLACLRVHHKPLVALLMDEVAYHPAATRHPKPLLAQMRKIDEDGDWLSVATQGYEGSYELRFLLTKAEDGVRRVSAFLYDARAPKRRPAAKARASRP